MRLLTLPITVVRVPFELGFGAAKEAVKFAHGLVGGGEQSVEEPRPAPPPRRRAPSRRSGNGRASTGRAGTGRAGTGRATSGRAGAGRSGSGRARTKATATPPPAPVADEPAPASTSTADAPAEAAPTRTSVADETAEPTHVSEEPQLVAEAAETGAEDGAGAEVAVDEPWPGYDQMNAPDIEDRLVSEGRETAAAVSLYEASRKGRASILEAASRSMTG
jgi:hypothetical protein